MGFAKRHSLNTKQDMKTKKKDASILASIEDLLAPPKIEAPSGGWLTINEWSEKTGLCRTATINKIRAKVNSGEWEEQPFPRVNRLKAAQPVPHYRKKP